MNRVIDISKLPIKELPILSNEEAGSYYFKWSYVNIYCLKDLRNIYILCNSIDNEKKTVKEIAELFNLFNKSAKVIWTERKVLEYLNALVKFELLDSNYNSTSDCFKNSNINEDLTTNDLDDLRTIFFNYFRFRELSSWFVNPEVRSDISLNYLSKCDFISNSKPLYYYSERNRFTDTFLIDIESPEYKYITKNDTVMRFWDVFLKWGVTLKILDRFNISKAGYSIHIKKDVSIAYFINPFFDFDLINFIEYNFESNHILIPNLIYKLVLKYRFSVLEIKEYITLQILNNSRLTFERTSEIFLIKGKTKAENIRMATYLFPKIDNFYISHIILRK